MTAHYNEWDGFAAAWLRELIGAGHLPAGDVDERSISDLDVGDAGPVSHFFAGIGGWPYALRLAGWPDHWPVWSASLPCPPFSAAGKGQECPSCAGKSALAHPLITAGWVCLDCGDEWRTDDRHLLPEFVRILGERRPAICFGEQVAGKSGRAWFAGLRLIMEALGYAVVSADLCAASVGAPHIRQRLFWGAVRLENAGRERRDGEPIRLFAGGQYETGPETARRGATGGLADDRARPRALHGGWSDADWLLCRDGKWRPVEPGTFPLADGIPGRVGRLRGYGNAIVPQVAAEFVTAFLESVGDIAP